MIEATRAKIRFHPALQSLMEPISRIGPHPENPKAGDTDAIIMSIRANGVYRPVYAQRSTGYALAGNHLYAALMELQSEWAPVIWLEVDDAEARRILAVDNRSAELGRYDDAMLYDLLKIMEAEDSLVGTGYAHEDLVALDSLLQERASESLNPEDWPEPGAHPIRCPSCGYEWTSP